MTRQQYIDFCKEMYHQARLFTPVLIRYVRDKNNNPRGVVVGFWVGDNTGGKVWVGASFCDKRDKFDKHIGIYRALFRSTAVDTPLADKQEYYMYPRSTLDAVCEMRERAKRYFKRSPEEQYKLHKSITLDEIRRRMDSENEVASVV